MTLAWVWGPLLLQSALLQASYAAVRPMVSYRGMELGLSGADLVVLVASFSALPLLAAFFVGRAADRVGPFSLLVGGAGVALVSNLLIVGATGLTAMLAGSMLLGLGHMTCIVGQQVAVATVAANSRDKGFGWLSAAGALGQVLGPPTVGLVANAWDDGLGLTAAGAGLATSGLIAGAAFAVTFKVTSRPSEPQPRSRTRPASAARDILSTPGMWQAMLLSGVILAALDLVAAVLPLWAESRGISIAAVGLLLGLRGAVTFASRLAMHRLVVHLGRRRVLVVAAFVTAAALAALPAVGLTGAVVAMVLLGLGFGIVPPLTAAWVSAAVTPTLAGGALGLRLSVNRLLQVGIPLTLGLAAGGGAGNVFVGSSLLLVAAGAAATKIPSDRGM